MPEVKPKAKRRPGRPCKCTPDVTRRICDSIAAGNSLRATLRNDPTLPNRTNVMDWLLRPEKDALVSEFCLQYAAARQAQFEHWADEINDIGDDGSNDYMEVVRQGRTQVVFNQEAVMRSKLRCDNRKWLLSKLDRKKYGDVAATVVNNTVTLTMTEDERIALIERRNAALAELPNEKLLPPANVITITSVPKSQSAA